jgi:HD-like signal output (HDOD) protein
MAFGFRSTVAVNRMKKRILFVEENELLLQMYLMMLEDEKSRWEVGTAANATEALKQMEFSPFDVIVSDVRAPGGAGLELFNEARQRFPRTSRIVISGLNDQEEVARSLGSTHQFLPKPFDVKTLKATLHRICGLDSYLKDEKIKGLVGQFNALPSFPSLYIEIMKELGAEDPSVETIASIISRDPGMTAKMLQIVNSAAVGLSRKVGSPFEAVQFLGLSTVRSLVLSAHIFSCFEHSGMKGFSVNDLWNHGMKTGRIACMILQFEQAEPGDVEDAYTAGMLHDIGKLMLADSLPHQFQKALALSAERGIHLHEAELEVFGVTHAGVAAYLLGLWGLPATIVEAVAFHHIPTRSDLRSVSPLTAVHVANVLEHEMSKTKARNHPTLDMEYLTSAHIDNRLKAWQQEAMKLLIAQNGYG